MPEYKLIHFNTRFLAEPARFVFAYAGVEYEDCRISFDEWQTMKNGIDLPWNQLPVLELADGRKIGQSSAITEYLARKFELCGLDDWDAARCKEISGSMRDLRQEWRKVFFCKNPLRKNELKINFIENVIPRYFGQLSKMQEASGSDWLVCDIITWADLLVAHTIGFIQHSIDDKVLDAYPGMLNLKAKIWEHPKIKNWLQVRPKPDLDILSMIPTSV